MKNCLIFSVLIICMPLHAQISEIRKFLNSDTLVIEFRCMERDEKRIVNNYYFEEYIGFEGDSVWIGNPLQKYPFSLHKVKRKVVLMLPVERDGFKQMEPFFMVSFSKSKKKLTLVELHLCEDEDEAEEDMCQQNHLENLRPKRIDFAILKIKTQISKPIEIQDYDRKKWVNRKVGPYIFQMPAWIKPKRAIGVDSEVGYFKGKGVELSFDYGQYTDTGPYCLDLDRAEIARSIQILQKTEPYLFLRDVPVDTIIKFSQFKGLKILTPAQRVLFSEAKFGFNFQFKGKPYTLPLALGYSECAYYDFYSVENTSFSKNLWMPKIFTGRLNAGATIRFKGDNDVLGLYAKVTQKNYSLIYNILDTLKWAGEHK